MEGSDVECDVFHSNGGHVIKEVVWRKREEKTLFGFIQPQN